MKKVIFSRKGFDSQNGGMASPIYDSAPISLPIPYPSSTITYEDLGLGKIIVDLSKRKLPSSLFCHPDPDLEIGAFGQSHAAQGHLENQGVNKGDLFLFFGTFREAKLSANKFTWVEGSEDHHRIFGWLFVEKKIRVGAAVEDFAINYPAYARHPHSIGTWDRNNTIFIAPKHHDLFGKIRVKGFGKFLSTKQTCLTATNHRNKKSIWKIPDWLNPDMGGCGMSYHSKERYFGKLLSTVGKGQEFVASPHQSKDFENWLINLFESSAKK